MKLLITGATGFTGQHFAVAAEQAGHDVLVLNADLTDPAALSAELHACGNFDALVHLAAISFVGQENSNNFYAVNTIGTCNLLNELTQMPASLRPHKVLIASSANVYGNCELSPISESQTPAPVNHYAASKLAMEHLVRTFSDRLPVLIARPFNYTGPGQSPSFLIPKLVDHFKRKVPSIELGNLNVEREFNDVRMVCEIYLRLIERGKVGEIYNVCSGRPYSIQTVIDQLTQLTRHSIAVKINPSFARQNEVHRLCGNTTRLIDCVGPLPMFSLQDTLALMLSENSKD